MTNTPKYRFIVDKITEKIEHGEYLSGEKIPSENEFAKQFDVSVPTVRRALLELVHTKKIVRLKGKGTFVNSTAIHSMAKQLENSNNLIGFLIPPHQYDDSLLKMLRGVQRPLHESGYSLNVLCSDVSVRSESEMIQRCFHNNTAGLILFSSFPDSHREILKKLEAKGVPVVLLDRAYSTFPCNSISSYNKSGSYSITSYLINAGHEKIAFISADKHIPTVIDRIDGYRLALKDYNISLDENLILQEYLDKTDSVVNLVKKHRPTALQCVNDRVAINVMQTLNKAGYRIPDDISITGFDGIDSGRYIMPKLTTAVQQFEKMGEFAANLLLQQIDDPSGYSQIFLPVNIDINQSTKELKHE